MQIIELAMATATTADIFADADEVEPTTYVFDLPFVGADREVAFTTMLTDAQLKAYELKTGLIRRAQELRNLLCCPSLSGLRALSPTPLLLVRSNFPCESPFPPLTYVRCFLSTSTSFYHAQQPCPIVRTSSTTMKDMSEIEDDLTCMDSLDATCERTFHFRYPRVAQCRVATRRCVHIPGYFHFRNEVSLEFAEN